MFKNKFYFITLFIALSFFSKTYAATSCRALTFSGAGAFGAYEAGVIWGLNDKYGSELQWQVATGISAGSINAAGVAMYNVGDEKDAVNFLVTKWSGISPELVYCDWKGGVVDGLLFQRGIYDTSPLLAFLTECINSTLLRNSDRQYFIGATNLDTGLFDQFGKNETDLALSVVASCSIPGIFPPTEMNGFSYADGGVTYMTPITDAARLCYESGATEVTVDMATVSNGDVAKNVSTEKTIDLLLRSGEIIVQNFNNKDIETLFQAFPNTILNIYRPSEPLPGTALSFTYSKQMLQIGYKDGQDENNVIRMNVNNYKEMLKKFNTN